MSTTTKSAAAKKAWATRRAKTQPKAKSKLPVVEANSEIASLKKTVAGLKTVVAQLLTQGTTSRINSTVKGISAKVVESDPLQIQARKQIRELVQDYASKRANELVITGEDRRIFFDLAFKALYNAYKEKTPNKLDLKQLADEQTELTGTKVSGLQIAEKLGLAIELLAFAKSFYNVSK